MLTLLILSLALSMDAFAAAVTKGAAARPAPSLPVALVVGLAFGVAQFLMPLLGWALGRAFSSMIRGVDHWVAFALLLLIGSRMIYEALSAQGDTPRPARLTVGLSLIGAAVATSIDAAAAGVTLAFLDQAVLLACTVIGAVTFALSATGVLLGGVLGAVAGRRAEMLGGLFLVGLGIKILVQHQFLGGG